MLPRLSTWTSVLDRGLAPLRPLPDRKKQETDNVRLLRMAPSANRRIAPVPLQTLRIAGLEADLLLPAAGDGPEASFAKYRERLAESGVFEKEEIDRLAALEVEPSPAFEPDRPLVGIVLNEPRAFTGAGGVRELSELLRELGCRVVLIPPCADLLMPDDPVGRANGIRSIVERLDGLVGPGGDDVDPAIYGEKRTYAVGTNLRRDRFEADLALTAKHAHLFMFGICRSHQLWNAADGGSLVQDVVAEGRMSILPRQRETDIPFDKPFVLRDREGKVVFENRVLLDPNSRMSEVTRQTELRTNANHHQAVDVSGNDLEIVGTLAGHDVVEATERWNAFTVQWHPEAMWSDPIQRRLLGTVGRRAALFRAAKRLAQEKKAVTAEGIEAWYHERFGVLDASDSRWIRRDLVPHWYGSSAERSYATR